MIVGRDLFALWDICFFCKASASVCWLCKLLSYGVRYLMFAKMTENPNPIASPTKKEGDGNLERE